MLLKKHLKTIGFLSFGLLICALRAVSAEPELLEVPGDISSILRETAMPELGDSQLERLLTRYYEQGLGGADVWNAISSMRIKGKLTIDGTEFKMDVFQRKPDRLKMLLKGPEVQVEVGYDGEEAWQFSPDSNQPAVVMSEIEARRFIHSSVFGNYLLYPYRAGKIIEYMGAVTEDSTVCHRIRVTLPNAFTVEYYIDVRSYLDTKIVNIDTKLNNKIVLICEDYKTIDGFPVAHKVISNQDDGTLSTLLLDDIEFNVGLTEWMFKRPDLYDQP